MNAREFVPDTKLCISGGRQLMSTERHPQFDYDDAATFGGIDATDLIPRGACMAMDTKSFTFALAFDLRDGWIMRAAATVKHEEPAQPLEVLPIPEQASIPPQPASRSDRALQALVRKLHGWELDHLRELVEEQLQELETLRAENDQLRRAVSYAEDLADSWRDDALRAIEAAGATPGLTMDGHLVPLHQCEGRLQ